MPQFLIPKWRNGSVTAFLKHMQVGVNVMSAEVYNTVYSPALASGCMAHRTVDFASALL